jgi:hypothetical protein
MRLRAKIKKSAPSADADFQGAESWLGREMLDVRLGRATEIDGATPAERDDVSRTPGRHDFSTKAFIGVARHKLLRFADRGLDSGSIEGFRDSRIERVCRQFDAVAVRAIVDRFGAPEVDGIALETFLHQRAHNLRKGHRMIFRTAQAFLSSLYEARVQFPTPP